MRHQDSFQVGMAAEADAKHVEHFPFVPVGSRKYRGDTGNLGIFTFQLGLYPDIAGCVKGEQMIINGKILVP